MLLERLLEAMSRIFFHFGEDFDGRLAIGLNLTAFQQIEYTWSKPPTDGGSARKRARASGRFHSRKQSLAQKARQTQLVRQKNLQVQEMLLYLYFYFLLKSLKSIA